MAIPTVGATAALGKGFLVCVEAKMIKQRKAVPKNSMKKAWKDPLTFLDKLNGVRQSITQQQEVTQANSHLQ
jgi:hypothetical protein